MGWNQVRVGREENTPVIKGGIEENKPQKRIEKH